MEKVNLRVEIDPAVSELLTLMAGERRKSQFVEDVLPAVHAVFVKMLEGKFDPFDPLARVLLPYMALYRRRETNAYFDEIDAALAAKDIGALQRALAKPDPFGPES